jgi:hypothetical protein
VKLVAFGVGWPPEGSLDKTVVNEVYRVIVGNPGHPEQFPYIDCWQDAVLSHKWLRPYLGEACTIMVPRVAAASKCRGKAEEPVGLRILRRYHHPMCHFTHLCHQCPGLDLCL